MKLVHRVLTLFLALPGLPVIAGMSVAPMEKVFMQDNRPMELVGKLNQLDFGNDSREDIDIPEVAVVGTQSAGKSTVVSRLLGNIRLFSSEELATAVPTKIHSLNVPEERLNFTLWIDGQKDASRATDRLDLRLPGQKTIETPTSQKTSTGQKNITTPLNHRVCC